MRPYARQGKKIRINNRRKFNAGARRVSWEINPGGLRRQGLTADELRGYLKAMV